MPLTHLTITNFRNLLEVELKGVVTCGFNLITGLNGSGKTSLLEAIHFLSLGRSFRSTLLDRIINNQAEKLSIFANILSSHGQSISVGLERNQDKSSKMRVDGKDHHSIAELTRLIPIRLINSQSYGLLDGGPLLRRKYLDWGLFYQKNEFLSTWQRFERVLKQRNAALKNHLPRKEVEIWNPEWVEAALLLDQARSGYAQALVPLLLDIATQLLGSKFKIEMNYQKGWDNELELERALVDAYPKDAWQGYTQLGPQKADLKILINGVSAKDFLSRGQQKLFVCAMLLAQGKLLSKQVKVHPIFLVDDLPSELDNYSLGKIMGLLEEQKAQVFVTAIDFGVVKDFLKEPTKLFHVEQGKVMDRL